MMKHFKASDVLTYIALNRAEVLGAGTQVTVCSNPGFGDGARVHHCTVRNAALFQNIVTNLAEVFFLNCLGHLSKWQCICHSSLRMLILTNKSGCILWDEIEANRGTEGSH